MCCAVLCMLHAALRANQQPARRTRQTSHALPPLLRSPSLLLGVAVLLLRALLARAQAWTCSGGSTCTASRSLWQPRCGSTCCSCTTAPPSLGAPASCVRSSCGEGPCGVPAPTPLHTPSCVLACRKQCLLRIHRDANKGAGCPCTCALTPQLVLLLLTDAHGVALQVCGGVPHQS